MIPDDRYVEMARAIVVERLRGQPVDVFLFGSWARGQADRLSDIDIAVLPRRELPPLLLANLREALEESPIPYPVEIVDLRETSPSFRDRVLREGIRWSA